MPAKAMEHREVHSLSDAREFTKPAGVSDTPNYAANALHLDA